MFSLNIKITWAVYILLDILLTGFGMGVPIFCIMFGFPTGWYSAKRILTTTNSVKDSVRKIFVAALVTSFVTFIMMLAIWGPSFFMLFDHQFDVRNYGHPFFLYDPHTSFIGWLVLMIGVSPFLQLLATIFASYVTLMKELKINELT